MKKILLLLLLPILAKSQQNDTAFIKKIADEMLQNGQAYQLLHYLTKNIGGRLAGSSQYNQAVQWSYETLKKFNSDTVFLQECLVPHWIRGHGDAAFLINKNESNTKKPLSMTAIGNSLGSQNVITAPLLFIENFDDLEKKKEAVKGKIVYYNAAFNPTNIRTFKSYSETAKYRVYGPSHAAKYGAIGVVVRSLSEATNNFPHTGTLVYNDSFPTIPAICIGIEDADYIAANAKTGNWFISLKTHGKMLPDTINHNVIAELKGTEFPNEYITIGGHLDSWDICEGAHDDGAGVVQTMEILRTFKALGYQPKHTIRFVLFANEENGTRGGLKYAALAKDNNEKHIFALESDAGGFTPRGFGFTMSAEKIAAIQPWLFLLNPYGTEFLELGGGGADIGPLYKNFGTPIAGFIPDSQRYFDIHHAANDTFEKVNKRELLLGAVNMAALVYLVDKYGL
ncbi:MAG: M20/M25/M40 family metallo-hydrolase [Chitinophagaceae bacterium]|nr:M20/M25/M40 family metallo-hydrolase [Chitinophagaceae bacterium]MCW5906042.1 M20/M25/M40 family metallo-hydrolase [Chitinophagaceae bacterium]